MCVEMADLSLRKYDDWRKTNPQIYFLGSVGSGSLLLGSSIAYPILVQDHSAWSSIAVNTFFLSAGLFNTFQILEVYLYGHYTLAICTVAVILNIAFGETSLPEHVRFIPVYFMGSTFLTAAWPSLFRSLGVLPSTLDDMATRWDYTPEPMSEVYLDDDTNGEIFRNDSGTGSPIEDWVQQSQRHHSSPLLDSTPVPPEQGNSNTQASREPIFQRAMPPGLDHMGPSSTYSDDTHYTGNSISLASRGSCPSEMSSNVARDFFQESTLDRPLRPTQRRRDIESLGRKLYSTDVSSHTTEGATDKTDIIKFALRKAQSL